MQNGVGVADLHDNLVTKTMAVREAQKTKENPI